MDYVAFSEEHMPGILRICEAEGWPSFPADPQRAVRALTAPGVLSMVAVEDGEVVGFAQMLTDGALQAFLCLLAVAREARGQGVGRKLVEQTFAVQGLSGLICSGSTRARASTARSSIGLCPDIGSIQVWISGPRRSPGRNDPERLA